MECLKLEVQRKERELHFLKDDKNNEQMAENNRIKLLQEKSLSLTKLINDENLYSSKASIPQMQLNRQKTPNNRFNDSSIGSILT